MRRPLIGFFIPFREIIRPRLVDVFDVAQTIFLPSCRSNPKWKRYANNPGGTSRA